MGLINPAGIPVIAGDMAALRGHAREIGAAGAGYSDTGARIHRTWQGLREVYRAPEIGRLVAATGPVAMVTRQVGDNLQDARDILIVYADEVEVIHAELAGLRSRAEALRADAAAAPPDPWSIGSDVAAGVAVPGGGASAAQSIASQLTQPWQADQELVDRNNALIDAVAVQVAAFTDAERRCANALRALHGAPPLTRDDGDGDIGPMEHGYSHEQLLLSARAGADQGGGLPWGGIDAADPPWHVDVVTAPFRFAAGLRDAGVQAGLGIAALGGYDHSTGAWTSDTAGSAWSNFGKVLLAAGTYLNAGGQIRDQIGAVPFLEPGEGGRLLTEAGKALIAWDQWDDDPARAAGNAVGNVGIALFGTKGAGAGLSSAGAALQAGRVGGVTARIGAGLQASGTALSRIPTLDDLAGGAWRRLTELHASRIDPLPALPDAPGPRTARADAPPGSLAEELTPSASSPADIGPSPGRAPADAPAAPRRDDEPAAATAAADQPPRREADDDEIDALTLAEPSRESELVHAGPPPQVGHANGSEATPIRASDRGDQSTADGVTGGSTRNPHQNDPHHAGEPLVPPTVDPLHNSSTGNVDGPETHGRDTGTQLDTGTTGGSHDPTPSDSTVPSEKPAPSRAVEPPEGWPPTAAVDKVPSQWGEGRPTKKFVGRRWEDPNYQGNGVRIDLGNVKNSQHTQQVDHVIVRYEGKVIGRDGKPLPGAIEDFPELAHIPLVEWINWRDWFRP